MPTITLPDGSQRKFPNPVTGFDLAADIGPGLAKAALAMKVDGRQRDLSYLIEKDADVSLLTLKDAEGLDIARHTYAAQILARAIKNLYPTAKLAIGPTIEHGFYYDVAFEQNISSDDLEKVAQEMKKILQEGNTVTREEWLIEDAKAYFNKKGESYKVQLIEDAVTKGENVDKISLYIQRKEGDTSAEGHFIDLCRGPHVPEFSKLNLAFTLTSLAAAYWKGDAKNDTLTRIYALAFADKKQLAAHQTMLEEAAKRDHRKLGKELGLFTFAPEDIGPGLPLWLPKGTVIRDELEKWAREEEAKDGYHRVVTPVLTKESLYYKSGHLPYYKEDMYAPIEIDEEKYYLRPMNCPHHHHIFLSDKRSYRDMPLRVAEYGNVFRYESHGGLSGLMRVRGMCMNDAHIYCREDQAEQEFIRVMELHARLYRTLGIEDFWMRLSKPDLNKLDKYVDNPDKWLKALEIIRSAMEKSGLKYIEAEGEAAFYGPKVDFQIKSVIGQEYTISTNQLDFLATERFELTYMGEDGGQHPVYVIHRAPLGTHERFTAFLIEHFAGNFPLWLAPIQVVAMGITEKHNDYVEQVVSQLREAGFRVEGDYRNEKVNYKIREHSHQKVPVILVAGDREAENQSVTLRRLGSQDQTTLPLAKLIENLTEEVATKALPPHWKSNDNAAEEAA